MKHHDEMTPFLQSETVISVNRILLICRTHWVEDSIFIPGEYTNTCIWNMSCDKTGDFNDYVILSSYHRWIYKTTCRKL